MSPAESFGAKACKVLALEENSSHRDSGVVASLVSKYYILIWLHGQHNLIWFTGVTKKDGLSCGYTLTHIRMEEGGKKGEWRRRGGRNGGRENQSAVQVYSYLQLCSSKKLVVVVCTIGLCWNNFNWLAVFQSQGNPLWHT